MVDLALFVVGIEPMNSRCPAPDSRRGLSTVFRLRPVNKAVLHGMESPERESYPLLFQLSQRPSFLEIRSTWRAVVNELN